ncbi:MAG: adenylyltransferase/cytidyltransferase family protein [Oliverpabstia sp.]|nr:adenylyltransferase/cytidyltransferase family protein [Oliverpabstia sp.]
MTKVITYGTYDLLHYGHIRLLERAKELGDYLIVGVTADDFDKTRGKINVQQSLMERVEAVRATGIADEIIIEEYEGQKIDDIRKYDVDIFTVGSDWVGKFDYLNEYCEVVYLDRTQGVSSSEIRKQKRAVNLGLVGDGLFLNKVIEEAEYVNGLQVNTVYSKRKEVTEHVNSIANSLDELLEKVDSVYIRSLPQDHYVQVKKAINAGKHVLCESPISLDKEKTVELFELAKEKNVILMEAVKTAYATAFSRLLLLVKGGRIGDIVSVEATCTSLRKNQSDWCGIHEWGPTALLPVFELLGANTYNFRIASHLSNGVDEFSKIDFWFEKAVASIKVGDGVKSEGELIISGTKGYIYVPAPWWKTDYFEIRYEDQSQNKRYFYQLDGEGIRYELVAFARAIERGRAISNITEEVSVAISDVMNAFENRINFVEI